MHKQRAKLEWDLVLLGFILSVAFMVLVSGLFYISYHAGRTGMTDERPFAEAVNTSESYAVRIANWQLSFQWEDYRRAEPILQRMAVFVPAMVRVLTAVIGEVSAALSVQMAPASSA